MIEEVLNPLNYRLQLPNTWRIHPIFHATLLSPYKENDIHGKNFIEPPPDLIEGEPEYEVEAILSHRRRGKGYWYLIKWKGYSTGNNTWEPEQHLKPHAAALLKQYKDRHRQTIHRIYSLYHDTIPSQSPPRTRIRRSLRRT